VAALTLDGKRIQQNRADIIFCKVMPQVKHPRKEVIRTQFEKHFIPFVFNKWTEILVFGTSILLITIGVFSTLKYGIGLNQNVSLVEGSDIFYYFNTLFDIGEAGPPAYLVFNNINYTIPENLDYMSQIQIELASINKTVLSPIYSWVSMFQSYVKGGTWSEACGSDAVALLSFDEQMKEFVKLKVNDPCCQLYGICGEQFSADIVFDDDGIVVATRFRFQLQPLLYQQDYINGLLETRRATD
jgi:Niemann-Pick C1 protein